MACPTQTSRTVLVHRRNLFSVLMARLSDSSNPVARLCTWAVTEAKDQGSANELISSGC